MSQSPSEILRPAAEDPELSAAASCQGKAGGEVGNIVPLLFSTNALFLQHATVCLTSLLVNNPDLFFDVVIVSNPAEHLDSDKVRRSLGSFSNYSLRFQEFIPPVEVLPPLDAGAHYTLDTWTRFWVAEFFPADVNRMLYLDADMVVVGSIRSLWQTNLDGALLAAVDIPGSQIGVNALAIPSEAGYFNAGVMLIDLKQWRSSRALDTLLDFVRAYPDRLASVDQDVLNACFYNRRKRLDYKWNVIRPFFRDDTWWLPLTQGELEEVRRQAVIIHYNGGLKPWSYFSDHPRRDEYHKYLRMTEWRDFVPADRTAVNIVRKRVSAILPSPVKALLKTIGTQLSWPPG
jgi:lipopolysaccharide biosynthesis glycosyltransferase